MAVNAHKYFGTDGIRGRVGSDFINIEFMMKLGLAAGRVLARNTAATVLIGQDTRLSGDMLCSALQSGLSAAGVNVQLLGVLPTPAVAHLTRSLQASAGVVISASHNGYQDNGVKFFDAKGMKLPDEMEAAIEAELQQLSLVETAAMPSGTIWPLVDAAGRYIEFCKSTFPYELALNALTIVLDCANGATSAIAPNVFAELGANVIAINATPNGKNINQCCGATNLSSLQTAVAQHKADMGLAFDGDGDRLMMVDHKGEIVDGDEILYILAKKRMVERRRPNGIVGTVMSNLGLEQALTKEDIGFKRTLVGDRYVLEALIDNGWTLGGEPSGHIVDLNYTTTGDGIITGLQVLCAVLLMTQPLHDLKRAVTKRPQVLINVPIERPVDVENDGLLCQKVEQVERQLGEEGRVLLRSSGTEPLVRVMIEGSDQGLIQHLAESLAATVREATAKQKKQRCYDD